MLADSLAVEFAGHASKFNLSVQRLVGNTQQGAVRNPEAKAVGRNGSRFHVEGNGARLRQPANDRDVISEFPIAIVDAGDGPGAHDAFELEPSQPRDLADRLFKSDLHLGE